MNDTPNQNEIAVIPPFCCSTLGRKMVNFRKDSLVHSVPCEEGFFSLSSVQQGCRIGCLAPICQGSANHSLMFLFA